MAAGRSIGVHASAVRVCQPRGARPGHTAIGNRSILRVGVPGGGYYFEDGKGWDN